jgi:hypothetical protein
VTAKPVSVPVKSGTPRPAPSSNYAADSYSRLVLQDPAEGRVMRLSEVDRAARVGQGRADRAAGSASPRCIRRDDWREDQIDALRAA